MRTRTGNWRSMGGLSNGGRLKMTSLMDILVVLLLFLLKSFVADGQLLTPTPGVDLPESTSRVPPEETLVVAIVQDAVLVGGEPVASVSEIARANSLDIPGLAASLQGARERSERLSALRGDAEPVVSRATIQADRSLEFRVLQKVMATLSRSGYEQISLAVIKSA